MTRFRVNTQTTYKDYRIQIYLDDYEIYSEVRDAILHIKDSRAKQKALGTDAEHSDASYEAFARAAVDIVSEVTE